MGYIHQDPKGAGNTPRTADCRTGTKLEVDENINMQGLWRCTRLPNTAMFKGCVACKYTQNKLEEHLLQAYHYILLVEQLTAIDKHIIQRKGPKSGQRIRIQI